MYEKAERWLSAGFFPALLLLFMVSFYTPISAKMSNNIFYAGLGVPALLWWLKSPRSALGPFRVAPAFFACLGVLATTLAMRDISFAKDALYVVALFLACVMLERNENALRRTYFPFAIIGLVMLGTAAAEWLITLGSAGVAPRITLWGRTENPIFAALMIISGIIALWVFHVEPALQRRALWAWWTGFVTMTALCAACVLIFQARSALLGFAFFLLGYALQRHHVKAVAIVLAAVAAALFASGAFSILLERGLSYRLEIWGAAISRLVDECGVFAGCGKDQYRLLGEFYHPHSGYISVLYYGGLASFSALAAMAAAFFAQTWRSQSGWMLVALVGWGGLVTDTNGIITSPRTLWVFFWIPTFMALIESGRPALEAYFSDRRGRTVNPRG